MVILKIFTFTVFFLAIPMMTLIIRRLHDLNCSGYWIIVFIIPSALSFIGFAGVAYFSRVMVGILSVILLTLEGTQYKNRYGYCED